MNERHPFRARTVRTFRPGQGEALRATSRVSNHPNSLGLKGPFTGSFRTIADQTPFVDSTPSTNHRPLSAGHLTDPWPMGSSRPASAIGIFLARLTHGVGAQSDAIDRTKNSIPISRMKSRPIRLNWREGADSIRSDLFQKVRFFGRTTEPFFTRSVMFSNLTSSQTIENPGAGIARNPF